MKYMTANVRSFWHRRGRFDLIRLQLSAARFDAKSRPEKPAAVRPRTFAVVRDGVTNEVGQAETSNILQVIGRLQ
jgi:hypothetical protein